MALNRSNAFIQHWDDPNAPLPLNDSADDQAYVAINTRSNLSDKQLSFINGGYGLPGGSFDWASHDRAITSSVTTGFDNNWLAQESLTGSDFSPLHQDQLPVELFGQLPEFVTQPVTGPSNPRPKPLKRPLTSPAAGKRETEDNDSSILKKRDKHDKNKGKGKPSRRKNSVSSQSALSGLPTESASPLKGKKAHSIPATNRAQRKARKQSSSEAGLEVNGDCASGAATEIGGLEDGVDVDGDYHTLVPKTQRERNRIAATKCRAKIKAAMSQLEEDNQVISETNSNLHAQVAALRSQVVSLRTQLLEHGDCDCPPIQNYIQNAAKLIGDGGGRHPIWGPDGRGGEWIAYHTNTSPSEAAPFFSFSES